MFHRKKSIFSCVSSPTSIRFCWIIHEVRKCILYLALTHRANIWSTKLQHVLLAPYLCFWSSTDPLVGDFFFLPSQIQPYGTKPGHRDKHFPWQCQCEFPFTCVSALQWVCAPSQLRWFPVAHTVIRPLYTICQAINRRLHEGGIILQSAWWLKLFKSFTCTETDGTHDENQHVCVT